jgi:hypothetical protein
LNKPFKNNFTSSTKLPSLFSSCITILLTILYDFYVSASPSFIGMFLVAFTVDNILSQLRFSSFVASPLPPNVMTIHQLAPVIERTCTLFIDDNALASAFF